MSTKTLTGIALGDHADANAKVIGESLAATSVVERMGLDVSDGEALEPGIWPRIGDALRATDPEEMGTKP